MKPQVNRKFEKDRIFLPAFALKTGTWYNSREPVRVAHFLQRNNFALLLCNNNAKMQIQAAIAAAGEKRMKVMAIDLGDARTGVAVSDALGMLTGSTSVIESWNREKTAQLVADAYKKSGAERLVMGFPRNMDGSEGPRADLYREFAAKLEELLGEKIVLWDERRTTIEAHQILSDNNYHGKKRKKTVDAVAASLILEGYLNYLRTHRE